MVNVETTLAIELKCPYPGNVFKPPVHYEIPERYVTQLLSEMVALNVETLLYVSYSRKSSTAFIVKFDTDLWKIIWNEMEKKIFR